MLQECSIDMEVDSLDHETVTLLPNNIVMAQPEDMTLFTITKSALVNASLPSTGIRMKFSMKRKIMSEMMTTYFPSFLLMMITYATTFFKPFFFEAALSVNLTTMLVMTTIFMSKMEGLPPTSVIKMLDIWLILCQLVPFVEVVLLTAMEYRRDEEESGSPRMINHHGAPRVVKPALGEYEERAGGKNEEERLQTIKFFIPCLKTLGR